MSNQILLPFTVTTSHGIALIIQYLKATSSCALDLEWHKQQKHGQICEANQDTNQ